MKSPPGAVLTLFIAAFTSFFVVPSRAQDQPQSLIVDLSSDTGPVSHGATGWLYGQSVPGIPTVATMSPLKPQISAQKPPDGLQHPSGDALQVADSYKQAGGKEIQIYLQDFYPDWPYNFHPIHEYIETVRSITRKVLADPNRGLFSYVPFNEPEYNWYGYSGLPFDNFLRDWEKVFLAIRELDPEAKIVGPNYSNYKSETYRQFLIFARDHNVLPQEMSWHELQDNSYPGWYDRYADYRAIEARLGIQPIPIVINEYTRAKGDLAVPGKIIQWITRLENRKVQGCLAYWTPSGTLSDLVARTWPNRVTGAWWVFEWYGSMLGNTVAVTPPDPFGFGLQAIASVEKQKKQARIILGGSNGAVNVRIKGLPAAAFLGESVHAAIFRVANTDIEPSAGPLLEQEGNYESSHGEITVPLPNTIELSAYLIVLSPAVPANLPAKVDNRSNHYEAEYASLSGATAVYGPASGQLSGFSGPGFVEASVPGEKAAIEFHITAVEDGYFTLRLRTSSASTVAKRPTQIPLGLNGAPAGELSTQDSENAGDWTFYEKKVFLAGGINLVSFDLSALRVDALDVLPTSGPMATYPVQSPVNNFGGKAKLEAGAGTSARQFATLVGLGAENFLQFNQIKVPATGSYKLIISYTNSEMGHSGQIERYADIAANGNPASRVYFRNTFDQHVWRTYVMDIPLTAGANVIRFSNRDGYGPDIDQIQIAAP